MLTVVNHPGARGPVEREASLAEVYDLDMGQRVEDLDMVQSLLLSAAGPTDAPTRSVRVAEVGCGRWRLGTWAMSLRDSVPWWHAIDIDSAMLQGKPAGAAGAWCRPRLGDAADAKTWAGLERVDLVLIPWSTLYLIPHNRQRDVLRHATAALRPGGILAVEVFRPNFHRPRGYSTTKPLRDGWVRHSHFNVDPGKQLTRVKRCYQRDGGDEVLVVRETIHWRQPSEVAVLVGDATGKAPHISSSAPVPAGSVLITATV